MIRDFWDKIGDFWAKIGDFWAKIATYGPRLPTFGPKLATFWPRLATFWPRLATFGPTLAIVWPRLETFGPRLATFGPRITPQTQKRKKNSKKHACKIHADSDSSLFLYKAGHTTGLIPIDWAGAVTLKNCKKPFKLVLIELTKIFCVAFNIFSTEDLDMKEWWKCWIQHVCLCWKCWIQHEFTRFVFLNLVFWGRKDWGYSSPPMGVKLGVKKFGCWKRWFQYPLGDFFTKRYWKRWFQYPLKW